MDRLPDELLTFVVEHLEVPDLRNMALVNRVCARVATPALYRRCALECKDVPQLPHKLAQLYRTCKAQPQLANLVRQIEIGHCTIFPDPEPDDNIVPLLLEIVPHLETYDFGLAALHALNERRQDLILALLLKILPNVTELRMNLIFHQETYSEELGQQYSQMPYLPTSHFHVFRGAIKCRPLKGTKVLQHLSKVHLCGDPSMAWHFNLISLFLRLPSMKHFYGSGCSDARNDKNWDCAERVSNVKTIKLEECDIVRAQTLVRLLGSCKSLTSFDCSRRGEGCADADKDQALFDYSIVAPALEKHRESLTTLHLRSNECCGCDDTVASSIESLQQLQHLTSVEIDHSALNEIAQFGIANFADILPKSLETFVFHPDASANIVDYCLCFVGLFSSTKSLRSATLTRPDVDFAKEMDGDSRLSESMGKHISQHFAPDMVTYNRCAQEPTAVVAAGGADAA